jgi:hypothetical protein
MIKDYYAVEKEYLGIKGKEAREAYVFERKKFVQEIEKVCSPGWTDLSRVILHAYSMLFSVKNGQKINPRIVPLSYNNLGKNGALRN